MFQIVLLVVIPIVLALVACIQYGTAIPALVVGGIAVVALVVSTFMFRKAEHFEVGIAWMLFFMLPALIVAVTLLLGSGIHYFIQYVAS